MSLSPGPVTPHGDGLFTWHAYDPACKAELWSTGFTDPQETTLFDPIDWPKESPWPAGPVRIVRTNMNHDRNCDVLLKRGASMSAAPGGFFPIPLPGAGEGETAFFHGSTGSLVLGDALINLAPHGLMLLPDKYCTDPSLLRKSLGKILDFPVRRIFFAHGDPILSSPLPLLSKILTSDPSPQK